MSHLDDSCFAYPALRRYPINTLESARNSYGAYTMQKKAYDKSAQELIEANFDKAEKFFMRPVRPLQKKAAARPTIALKGGDKDVVMTEITSLDELKAATDYILDKRATEKRADLAEAAKYVLWSASNTDVDMNTPEMRKIARIAGIGVGDRDKIQTAIEKRATMMVPGKDADAMWKFANDVKKLSDDEFFKEENINTLCNTLDDVDFMFNQHKKASDVDYPENVCFEESLDDLLKQASDLYCIKSIDTVLSKKATLARKDKVNAFMSRYFGQTEPMEDDALLDKLASLDTGTALALLDYIE